ncbi:MAG: ATP-binding protein [Magnetococcales bacterium]|nr:ATP-binding protein [Magnetococcales bacterium]
MLVSLTLENWMSFRDPATFSMIADEEESSHNNHVAVATELSLKILQAAAIYGGNASGKSNFIKALQFLKQFTSATLKPENPIPVRPFLLDQASESKPCQFEMHYIMNNKLYRYRLTVTRDKVLEETLSTISRDSDSTLFHRKDDRITYDKGSMIAESFKSTLPDNHSVLSRFNGTDNEETAPFTWLNHGLAIATPTSCGFTGDEKIIQKVKQTLASMDTGISDYSITEQEIPEDNLPKEIRPTTNSGNNTQILPFTISNDTTKGHIVFKNRKAYVAISESRHRTQSGEQRRFSMEDESDGTKRLFDLLPGFVTHSEFEEDVHAIHIVDELDRSLHTHASWQLVEMFLKSCTPDSRRQLIFTTHDVMLMDPDLLRLDEIWIAERDTSGHSELIPFTDFQQLKEEKYSKSWRKLYLQGRIGGIPDITPDNEETLGE